MQRCGEGPVLQAEVLREFLSAGMGRLDHRSSGVTNLTLEKFFLDSKTLSGESRCIDDASTRLRVIFKQTR